MGRHAESPPPVFFFLLLTRHRQISALARASQAFSSSPPSEESQAYLEAATKAAEFLRGNLYQPGEEGGGRGILLRSWRNGRASEVGWLASSGRH